MARPKKQDKVKEEKNAGVSHVVTQEDMDLNPSLAEQGVKVGDIILVEDQESQNGDTDVNTDVNTETNTIIPPSKGTTEVAVVKNGHFIRSYSKEIHGEDFLALAGDMATKINADLCDAKGLSVAIVYYRTVDKNTGVSFETSKVFTEALGTDFKEQALNFKNEMNGNSVVVK